MRRRKWLLALLPPLLLLASCKTLTFDEQLGEANKTVTAVVNGTDIALRQHLITPDQAQAVSTMAHQVNPLIDAANAANQANNATVANKSLNAINQILAGMQAYVASPTGATP